MRALILLTLGLAGCAVNTADVCTQRGVPPGHPNYWLCANMVAQEDQQRLAHVAMSLNATAANFNALAIANTPQYTYGNYNVWVH